MNLMINSLSFSSNRNRLSSGKTALDYAREMGNPDIIRILEKAANKGRTLTEMAMKIMSR